MHDEEVVETFRSSLLEIGAARNNNVQLSEETKANKKGFYDIFKEHLPTSLADAVEWKTNDGGRIKVRDIIALCWIGLSKMELPDGIRVNPNQIYRNKAVCVAAFNKLLEHEEVSTPAEGGYAYKLHNKSVKSAMQIAGVFPELYDMLYDEMPTPTISRAAASGRFLRSRSTIPTRPPTRTPSTCDRSRPRRSTRSPPITRARTVSSCRCCTASARF